MARWRLAAPHYLNTTDAVEWEYVEEDLHGKRSGGRPGAGGNTGQRRVRYPVPLMLDPRDPADHNYPADEAIIVANAPSRAFPHDIVFKGDPTPDMIPMDEDAERISAGFASKWVHPIESLKTTYDQSVIGDLEAMIKRAVSDTGMTPEDAKRKAAFENRSFDDAVPRSEFDRLKAELLEMKARLEAAETPDAPEEMPPNAEEAMAAVQAAAVGERGGLRR